MKGLRREEIGQRHPEVAARWYGRDTGFAPEGGESLLQFDQRCLSTVQRLAQAHAGRCLALVAHGGVLDCLYRAATGQALDARRAAGGWTTRPSTACCTHRRF